MGGVPGVEVAPAVEDDFGVGVGVEELRGEFGAGEVGDCGAGAEDGVEGAGGEVGRVWERTFFGAVEAFEVDGEFDVLGLVLDIE